MQNENIEESSSTEQTKKEKGEDSRFTEGEPVTLIRVRFPGNARSHPFLAGKRNFQYGQKSCRHE